MRLQPGMVILFSGRFPGQDAHRADSAGGAGVTGLSALPRIDIGIRHILPVYLFLFVWIGVVFSRHRGAWRARFARLRKCQPLERVRYSIYIYELNSSECRVEP